MLTMRYDINGFIVYVKEAVYAAPYREQRPVAGEYVGIELQMPGHVLPVQQVAALGRGPVVLVGGGAEPVVAARLLLQRRQPVPESSSVRPGVPRVHGGGCGGCGCGCGGCCCWRGTISQMRHAAAVGLCHRAAPPPVIYERVYRGAGGPLGTDSLNQPRRPRYPKRCHGSAGY